jgi:FkbM family methyltransferase
MIKIKRDGVGFYISSKDETLYGLNWWNNYGTYEKNLFKILKRNSKKYKVFIDIGSAIGAISLFTANLYPMTFGFEPNPVAYKIFMRNLKLNKYKNIIKNFNYAVTAADSREKFERGNLFSEINFHKIKSGKIIKCISLKKFLKDNKLLEEKTFIKIDIEGGEFNLLANNDFLSLFNKNNYCLYLAVHFNSINEISYKNRILQHLISIPKILKEYYLVYKLVKKFKYIDVNGKKQNNNFFFFKRWFRRNPDLYLYN